jgi:hypothetical protein
MLPALFLDRSTGGAGGAQPWASWLSLQWLYATRNFTLPGVLAAIAVAVLLLARTAFPGRPRVLSALPLAGSLATVVGLTGLHGLLYVVLFKNQAWFHDYWQFFLGPFVAASLAAVTVWGAEAVASRAHRLAPVVVAFLLASPWPGVHASFAFYSAQRQRHADYALALVRLGELVPKRAPVWTSQRWETTTETIGRFASRRPSPVVAYYANRPLLYSRDLAEIEANRPGCAAYFLTRSRKPWSRELEAALSRSHPRVHAGEDHVIFLLAR